MQSNRKSVPAPIFNHRKRPRQAIMSDPQDTAMSESSNNFQGLMPVGGFSNQRATGQIQRNNNNNTRSCFQNNIVNSTREFQSQFNKTTPNQPKGDNNPHRLQSGVGNRIQQQTNNRFNNRNVQNSEAKSYSDNQNVFNQSRIQTQQSNNIHSGYLGSTSKNGGRYNNPAQSTRLPARGRGIPTQQIRGQSYVNQPPPSTARGNSNRGRGVQQHINQSYRSPPQRNQLMNLSDGLNKPNRALFDNNQSNCTAAGTLFQNTNNREEYSLTVGASSGNQQSNNLHDIKRAKKTNVDVDRTLHVITTPIFGIRRWSKFKDSFPMMFEVYGIVDSALLRDKTGMGKEFVLRDEKDSIPCIFYEIDRQLPRLTRGQWHRCVGSYDSKLGKFKCVSVRPLVNGEERRMFKSITTSVENSLKQITHSLPEP